MMDIFCEFLVEKKSARDALIRALLVIACILFCMVSFYFLFFIKMQWMWLIPILWGAAIYGTHLARQQFSIEFEYSFTNGVLDIDKILGRSKRKRLVSITCRNIQHMGPVGVDIFYSSDRKVINANYDEKRKGKYYVNFMDKGEPCTLLFQPPEKILDNMKKYNPRNIEL